MRKIGITLVAVGALGFCFVAFRFAEAYQPMWIRVVKHLPDKPSYTHEDVQSAVLKHIEATRSTLYFGIAFSAIQIVGAVLVCQARGSAHGTHNI